jgi:hypothetical protein
LSTIDSYRGSTEGHALSISNNASGIILEVTSSDGHRVTNGIRLLGDDTYITSNGLVHGVYDGTFITDLYYEDKSFVTDVTGYTNTVRNVCTDLSINFDSQSANWNEVDIEYVYEIGTTGDGVNCVTNDSSRPMIRGFGCIS